MAWQWKVAIIAGMVVLPWLLTATFNLLDRRAGRAPRQRVVRPQPVPPRAPVRRPDPSVPMEAMYDAVEQAFAEGYREMEQVIARRRGRQQQQRRSVSWRDW